MATSLPTARLGRTDMPLTGAGFGADSPLCGDIGLEFWRRRFFNLRMSNGPAADPVITHVIPRK